jgi:hypothetical protein
LFQENTMKVLYGVALMLAAVTLSAQDAAKTLPESYVTQLENEWVAVTRVRYAPQAKLPPHAHTALPSAYVYLNDGGPVIFRHIGATYGAATRPATKAGSFRVYRGIDEIHEVENTSSLASEFLRVELKTDPKELSTLKGKFLREMPPDGESVEKVQFENAQVRITRIVAASGHSIRLSTAANEPALLIALRAATLRGSAGTTTAMSLGQERWLAAGAVGTTVNAGTEPSEFLRFDFKTRPIVATSKQQ